MAEVVAGGFASYRRVSAQPDGDATGDTWQTRWDSVAVSRSIL